MDLKRWVFARSKAFAVDRIDAMCGQYYSRRQKQEIAEHFHAGKVFDAPTAPNYSIAPMSQSVTI